MNIRTDEWSTPLLNGVLICAILFYASLPFLGLDTWHRVIPEHDHLFISADHHHDLTPPNDQILPSTPARDCVSCNSTQLGINVIHLPNPTGASSFFAFVIGSTAVITIGFLVLFVRRVPGLTLHAPRFISAPLDPPPNSLAVLDVLA